MDNMKERRQYIRTELPIPAIIRIKQQNNTMEEINTQSKNISAQGMMVELDKKLAEETDIELNLMPKSSSNPIHIIARITRSTKIEGKSLYTTGISFVKIEEDNKNSFLKFLCDTIYKLS